MKILFFICGLLFFYSGAYAQKEAAEAKQVIEKLCSNEFAGRGYVKKGIDKAATYLNNTYKDHSLKPLNKHSFSQYFTTPVNTFPGKMIVIVDGKTLIPGVHYIVAAESKGISGGFMLFQQDSVTYRATDLKREVPLIVKKQKKLTWSVATEQTEYTVIELLKDSFPGEIKYMDVQIENIFVPKYKLQNVCGYIKGKVKPDSFIVFTAHYDHLGMMGKEAMFPGANDNASGVSMLINLMGYYNMNRPDYSVAFIAFAGEEAGLLGSKYYVDHPLFPLSKIKFLVNMDLMGTGDEGITVVNATEFKQDFENLKKINEEQKLLPLVKPRGKAANSDHYWFTEKGVPAFFIYTMGGIKAYHDVYDIAATLPLTKYEELKKLLTAFAKSKMGSK
ncbi:MAG: M28 family peptidase [Bacteroidota bacterium]|nr:M28 family peptidase [Bacteroidota bacterium]